MAVLSVDKIRDLLRGDQPADRRLIATPLLNEIDQLPDGAAALDVTLGTEFVVHRRAQLGLLDPAEEQDQTRKRSIEERITMGLGSRFVLHPNQFALGATAEYFAFPPNLSGYVVGKSSWGRLGLIIATAIGIHPNYRGVITLELRNVGEIPIALYPGLAIAQIFFQEVEPPVRPEPRGHFLCSVRPETPSLKISEQLESIRRLGLA